LIERQPVTVTFTNLFDPSKADTAAGFLYSFDFDRDGKFEIVDSTSPTATFTPPAEGTFAVHGRIKDKDGGFSDINGTAQVANVDTFAVGAGAGMPPLVHVYDANRRLKFTIFAYSVDFIGGVNGATATSTATGSRTSSPGRATAGRRTSRCS